MTPLRSAIVLSLVFAAFSSFREKSLGFVLSTSSTPHAAAPMRIGTLLTATAVLRQELGISKFVLLGEISDADRLGRLESAARRRAEVGRQRGGAEGTILPADSRNQQKIGRVWTILKHLNMVDFHGSGNLQHRLVQEAFCSGLFNRKTTDIDQNADMAPEFIQHIALSVFGRVVLHSSLTSGLMNCA